MPRVKPRCQRSIFTTMRRLSTDTAKNLQTLALAFRETAFLRLRYIDVSFLSRATRISSNATSGMPLARWLPRSCRAMKIPRKLDPLIADYA